MKTLYLVRHAKSGWTMEGQPDIDRPLNERGYSDAHDISKHLHKDKFRPDVIITSPAIRAMSTALIFAGNLRYSKEDILIRQQLYETGRQEYIDCIHDISNQHATAMIFGHNPIISETAEYLIKRHNQDMPTCCVTAIDFEVDSWAKVARQEGKLRFLLTPASI